MKSTVALILALLAAVQAGVHTYRKGGNFAYVVNTQQHLPIPFLYQHPTSLPESHPQISYAYGIVPNTADYSDSVYSPDLYPLVHNYDELFRVGDDTENESKWFNSNPENTAHTLPTSITASASASTSNIGSTGFSSASNAVFQYPLLTLFHRLFNRPPLFYFRPSRPATVSSTPPPMRPVLNSINDSILVETLNLMNPFARPRP